MYICLGIKPLKHSPYLPAYYFIPEELLDRCPESLRKIPRCLGKLIRDEEAVATLESDLYGAGKHKLIGIIPHPPTACAVGPPSPVGKADAGAATNQKPSLGGRGTETPAFRWMREDLSVTGRTLPPVH